VSQCLVSVVVPVYNGEQYLEKTVESILSQDYLNLELILVDDGSSDNSVELIKNIAAQNDRIKPFYNSNGGVANARNFGIAQAKGEFVAFCDQDDLWLPTKLTKQIPLFDNSEVGLVYCGAITSVEKYGLQTKASFESKKRGSVFDCLILGNLLTCCTAVARKSTLLQVSNFDEDRALMGVDDWHLWLKLAFICQFDYVEEHLAVHVFHEDNYSSNDEAMHAAEIVCLNKIKLVSDKNNRAVDWSTIKQKIHSRYAKSYIFSGLYNLAGNTFIRAHQEKSNFTLYFKGIIFKYTPNIIWKTLQKNKRILFATRK